MAPKRDPSVCPKPGDRRSNRKGRSKSSRNTDTYVECETPTGKGNVPRFIKLSEHKRLDKRFQPNRPAAWSVKSGTMRVKLSPRTEELAKPKSIHKDPIDVEDKSKTAKRGKRSRRKKEPIVYAETPRFIYLSEPKKLAEGYRTSRPSPMWPVSHKTMRAKPSSRIQELARPKQLHKDWRPSKSVYPLINDDILFAVSSTRTDQLAEHKIHSDPPARKSYLWDYPYWDHEISEEAKTVSPTERIVQLAKPKGDYAGYVPSRPLDQPVSETVMSYTATERIEELAKPKSRIAAAKAEDPFVISEAAKNAVATSRLEKLAIPLPRKVTRKKL
ncbi:uncharacterized protein [Scyliorhinus torazame]|uniref:uncharacterized protein isoform X1 n=1 Tax=Scyliorhinus torazame TaxID=75743 RepID=UPI003B5CAB7B